MRPADCSPHFFLNGLDQYSVITNENKAPLMHRFAIDFFVFASAGGKPISLLPNSSDSCSQKFCIFKTSFHQQRSRIRSRSQSRKRPYYLVKIENRSRKRGHKLDGIGVGRIRKFLFSDSVYDSVAYDVVKTRLSESEAEAEELANRQARSRKIVVTFFRFCLRLRQCSFHLLVSRVSVVLPTPSV